MLDFIKEAQSVWDNLKTTTKPIILYGMGNGADKILDWCEANGVKVSGIFATDEFVRYQNFRGFVVERYTDIIGKNGKNILIVIAFASERPEVLARFRELAALHETVAPHLPLFSENELVSKAWFKKNEARIKEVYDLLADEKSRQVFACTLNYKLSGKLEYLFSCETEREEDLLELFAWSENEGYLDLGAYNGDTVEEFLRLTRGKCKKILAVEPDRRNARKLRVKAEELLSQGINIDVKECGIGAELGIMNFSDSGGRQSTFVDASKTQVSVETIDHLTDAEGFTYIKFDVEGFEKQALKGGEQTIKKFSPKLFVASYHYDEDILSLPLIIREINPSYKIYLRKHPYIPAWELNYIAKI
ncbi:MAG: FkbM family methyltransferase [Phascolarctobacterium sp.]|nr:FkbM family methyltransferase [Phascolarctobacterium sp.]